MSDKIAPTRRILIRMNWHRFLLSLIPLWPAVVVWLVICLPMLAFGSFNIRRSEWVKLPLFLRLLLWLVEHAPIYRKIARFGRAMAIMDDETREEHRRNMVPPCPVCNQIPAKVLAIDHALEHFPGEWEEQERLWWTPPANATLEQLDAWLTNRGTPEGVTNPYEISNAEQIIDATWCKPGECQRACEGFCDKAWDALVEAQAQR